jgi:hypothetical protein
MQKNWTDGLRVLMVIVALSSSNARAQTESSFVDLVSRSGFIFQGTVKAVGESTPGIVREANSAIVSVDRVLESQPPAGNKTGRDITVRLRAPIALRSGQTATFFTFVYAGGPSLGVEAVGTLPADDARSLEDRIRAARQTLADQALRRRLQSAQLVVVGTVTAVRPGPRNPESEHDPLWSRATIRITSAEKGRASEPVVVNFATNFDYLWALAPKPKVGDTGIYLLQPDPEKKYRVSGFFLIDPLDALPISELDRVRRLLQ